MVVVVDKVNYLARTVVYGGVVALAWVGYGHVRDVSNASEAALAEKQVRIEELTQDVAVQQEQIGELEEEVVALDLALGLLKVDHRVAHLSVLRQWQDEDSGETLTEVSFEEIGAGGRSLGPARIATIPGSTCYVDGLVVKFEDDYVEQGDALRGTSLVLFRRMFGENQRPNDGVELDAVGQPPLPYDDDGDGTPAFITDIWRKFWDYANDPDLAREAGVRAIHGEAPYIELREGGKYVVELRASDGLSIRRE